MLAKICYGIHYLSADSGMLEMVDLAFDAFRQAAGSCVPLHLAKHTDLLSGIVSMIERVQLPKCDRETASKPNPSGSLW